MFRQSSMVFTEQTGLTNLYSMVNYCINNTMCKRKMIAQHFNDTLNELCNEMCDYCKNLAQNKISNCSFDFINEVKAILECIDKNSGKSKDKRLTANKLSELSFNDINKNLKLTRTLDNGSKYTLTSFDIEKLILNMITRELLKEDFHFTPYNTICYIIKGHRSVDNEKEFKMIINDFPNNSVKPQAKQKKKKQSASNDIIVLDDNNSVSDDDFVVSDKKKKRKI